MGANPYTVKRVSGLRISERRAIAFLGCTTDASIDAEAAFQRLTKEREREVRNRFDYWIDGGIQDSYFHGWPNNPAYRKCFVFKWKEDRKCHRLYGFLIHPTPLSSPGFQVCVLASHATKTKWETDVQELSRAKALGDDPLAVAAVHREFPERAKGSKQWVN
jgi:hypothetical protein